MPVLTCFGCRRIESEAPGGKGQLLLAKADVAAVSRQLELALVYDSKLDVRARHENPN